MSVSRGFMFGALRSFYGRWTVSISCKPDKRAENARNMASALLDWNLPFDNLAMRKLTIDAVEENYVREVSGAFFSVVRPVPVEKPEMVSYSASAARLLDLESWYMERSDAAEYFSGNKLFEGSQPAAHCYCGHQFGYFAGQLGDGAAMYLGEVVNRKGERWELQLKGAGPTPYSRDADGRKVLRSSIREYLCSEAMYHLNIPTTRALTCVTSDSKVVRDVYYDGHAIMEKCTVVSRLAPTFLRFGSFEIFKTLDPVSRTAGPSVGRKDLFDQLLDYTISSFYPKVYASFSDDRKQMCAEFFKKVVVKTAHLVADWQCVGFCHGVLNTDNMSIVGLTIDYGPFGFIDHYNPDHICNGSDSGGRYSFANQPKICGWNLAKLAEALQCVLPLEDARSILEETYFEAFDERFLSQMKKKFGLITKDSPEDRQLVEDFLDAMEQTGADFTNSFRCLNEILLPGCQGFDLSFEKTQSHLLKQCCSVDELRRMHKPMMNESEFMVYVTLLGQQPQLLEKLGKGADVVKKEFERRKKFNTLKELSAEAKTERDEEVWRLWLEKYTNRLCLEVDDNSDLHGLNLQRVKVMNGANPRFVLRNYMVQVAIEAAERGDFSEVQKLLKILEDPYDDGNVAGLRESSKVSTKSYEVEEGVLSAGRRIVSYDDLPPDWAKSLRVTCSS